jgi:membrane-associated protease RseP (regulator of RpoE activity)
MAAGMAFAAGTQENNAEATAATATAARGYGAGPGEAGVPVENCLAELGDEAFRILAVQEGSPAAEAGLEAGHVVTKIDGELAPGETVTVSYIETDFAPWGRGVAFPDRGDTSEDDGVSTPADVDELPDLDEMEVHTATVTIGEQDGETYIGVSYRPLGPAGPMAVATENGQFGRFGGGPAATPRGGRHMDRGGRAAGRGFQGRAFQGRSFQGRAAGNGML